MIIDYLKKQIDNNLFEIRTKDKRYLIKEIDDACECLFSQSANSSFVFVENDGNILLLYKILFALKNGKTIFLESGDNCMTQNSKFSNEHFLCCLKTSGSTGIQKMIGVDEKTLLSNLISFHKQLPDLKKCCLFASSLFSFGFNCLLTILMFGESLILPDPNKRNDINFFVDYLNDAMIDTIFCAVDLLNFLSSTKLYTKVIRGNFSIVFAGDRANFSNEFINYCLERNIELFNVYGICETGVLFVSKVASYLTQNDFDKTKLLSPYKFYSCDKKKNVLSLTLFKGYKGFFDISNNSFVFKEKWHDSPRIFSTKDCFEERGVTIEIIGREDDIVEIDSHKVSTVAIEKEILAINGVYDCAVYAKRRNSGGNVLLASFVSDYGIDDNYLYLSLKKVFPDYMIPVLIHSPCIPYNKNGKKDKIKLISECEINFSDAAFVQKFIKKNVYCENLNLSLDYRMNKTLSQLGMDSLNIVFLASSLEETYLINCDNLLSNSCLTLGEIIVYLKGVLNERKNRKS